MIGSRILHYLVKEKLGEGGMGEVYLAEDTRLRRPVALKFLNRTFREDRDAHDRLVREARSASQLSHPHIVSIHAIEETDDHLFIVMEYVEGRSLRDLIKSGEIEPDRAFDFAGQILDALSAAHEAGIVHRDIKSDNIKVTEKGRVKVLDFGLARSAAGGAEVTRFGSSAGTPAYMSPEQVQGEKADHRSDLFSFGVVFYEMLTGQRPFRGQHESAITYSIVNEDPDRLSAHMPAVPTGLEPIVDRLLSKNRENRYQSAAEAHADLDQLRGGRTPSAAARPLWRRVLPAIAVLAVVALIVVASQFVFRGGTSETGMQTAGAERIKLVVLPFANLGPTDQEYFADGITEEVTTRLAKLSGLGVISRTSAMKYKATDKTLKEIGVDLDVDYALEGTIRWDKSERANRVRINTQLIRVSDETHLWAERFDRVYEQIFALESEIAENVAAALDVTLLEPEREAIQEAPTDNLEAYDYYLKGRELYDRANTHEDINIATTLVERAVKLDSTFSLAHALLARIYTNDYFNNRFPELPRLEQGRQAALAALRHNPDGPEGHVAMGYFYYYGSRDYENALAAFELAEELEPNNAAMLQAMGFVRRRQGNWDESLENLRRAQELDPTSLDLIGNVIETALYMRRFDLVRQYIDRGFSFAPDYPMFGVYRALALMFDGGDYAAAQAVLDEIEKSHGSALTLPLQVNLDILRGNYEKVFERIPNLARVLEVTGEADSANYYLMKGLAYDIENGLGTESETARAYYDSARAVWEGQLRERPEDYDIHTQLGLAYAGLRDKEKAYYHSKRATEILPMSKDALTGANLLQNEAVIKGLFGDADEALDILEQLFEIPSLLTPAMIEHNPLFEPLRDHPRMKELLRERKTL
jgi:TolB-like protein/Tfp pilus assembly protein PilF/predicted Ser/Thr protein kinase